MKSKILQIFKPGQHTAMNGAVLSFSEADIKATARAYDPAKHDAPIVVGHPQHDAPAYGWVKSLAFADGLEAEPHQVDPAFAEMVERGAFKKISASFYTPDSPSNPVPGVYYLRHVGFLGAQPPAVKGLRNPEFAEGEAGVVEFSEWGDTVNALLWRGLREWIIGKFGLTEADKVVPGYTVKNLEESAAAELKALQTIPFRNFTEPQPQGENMSDAEKTRLAALETENAALKAESVTLKKAAADFAEAEIVRKKTATHAEHLAFAETLVKEGRLLPAHQEATVATLDHLADVGKMVEFGEGDSKKPLLDALKAQLKTAPVMVDFNERARASGGDAKTVEFAAAQGYGAVDAEGLETHSRALMYQKSHPETDYLSAVKAVTQ